jgi:hypothetical protein
LKSGFKLRVEKREQEVGTTKEEGGNKRDKGGIKSPE